ncbi:DeoR family transcriptional regulator [Dactylosporangium matsuzakiense]|uniref:DeoR family transcriptional regulator n=1 Tax=Dactylosporangium matsuzakiense TaxID=53360 RepID=UPI0022F2F6A3|nr:DeoR family transcriptional regulator [Dactylosporangium matsuzakiense]
MSDEVEGGGGYDLLAAERQLKIASMLQEQEFATHVELLALTGSSLSTLRRDLRALERTGAVRRIRGGAARPEGNVRDHRSELEHLLVKALGLVRAGDVGAAEHCIVRAMQMITPLPHHAQPFPARDPAAVYTQRSRAGRPLLARRG